MAYKEYQEEVDLKALAQVLWSARWCITAVTILSAVLSFAATFIVSKQYVASIVVVPVLDTAVTANPPNGMTGSASQIGGLAALIGVPSPGESKKQEALAVLQSELLTERFVVQLNLLPVLSGEMSSVLRKAHEVPTLWEANLYFKSKIRSVSQDPKTGLTTLSITWNSPSVAAEWANGLVRITNDYLREQAIHELELNIAYLREQAAKTDVVEVRQSIYSLIENEIGKVALARGASDFGLRVVDPAFAPEVQLSPKPILWTMMSLLAGFLLSIVAVAGRHSWQYL